MKFKQIFIPIYFGKLIIIVTDDYAKVDAMYNTQIQDNLYEAVVFEIKDRDEHVVVFKEGRISWSVIAHEVVHIVNRIFLKCGIELDRENDEPQAYLTGWVMNEIDKFLKK